MKKVALVAAVALALILAMALAAHATPPGDDEEHKVGLCHRTASDSNPYVYIEVDEASLPAHLNDLPGHPAKAWKTDGTFRGVDHVAGDLKEDYVATSAEDCVDFQTSPTPTPTPTETPTPTPTETTPPPTTTSTPPPSSHSWTPTWTPSHPGKTGPPPTAMTGFSAGKAAIAAGLLLALGLGSLYLARRRAL